MGRRAGGWASGPGGRWGSGRAGAGAGWWARGPGDRRGRGRAGVRAGGREGPGAGEGAGGPAGLSGHGGRRKSGRAGGPAGGRAGPGVGKGAGEWASGRCQGLRAVRGGFPRSRTGPFYPARCESPARSRTGPFYPARCESIVRDSAHSRQRFYHSIIFGNLPGRTRPRSTGFGKESHRIDLRMPGSRREMQHPWPTRRGICDINTASALNRHVSSRAFCAMERPPRSRRARMRGSCKGLLSRIFCASHWHR